MVSYIQKVYDYAASGAQKTKSAYNIATGASSVVTKGIDFINTLPVLIRKNLLGISALDESTLRISLLLDKLPPPNTYYTIQLSLEEADALVHQLRIFTSCLEQKIQNSGPAVEDDGELFQDANPDQLVLERAQGVLALLRGALTKAQEENKTTLSFGEEEQASLYHLHALIMEYTLDTKALLPEVQAKMLQFANDLVANGPDLLTNLDKKIDAFRKDPKDVTREQVDEMSLSLDALISDVNEYHSPESGKEIWPKKHEYLKRIQGCIDRLDDLLSSEEDELNIEPLLPYLSELQKELKEDIHLRKGLLVKFSDDLVHRMGEKFEQSAQMPPLPLRTVAHAVSALLSRYPTENSIKKAKEELEKLIANPEEYIGRDWIITVAENGEEVSESALFAEILQSLESNKVEELKNPELRSQVKNGSVFLNSLLNARSGALIRHLNTFQDYLVDPENGQINKLFDFIDQAQNSLMQVVTPAKQNLTDLQHLIDIVIIEEKNPSPRKLKQLQQALAQFLENPDSYFNTLKDVQAPALLTLSTQITQYIENQHGPLSDNLLDALDASYALIRDLKAQDVGPIFGTVYQAKEEIRQLMASVKADAQEFLRENLDQVETKINRLVTELEGKVNKLADDFTRLEHDSITRVLNGFNELNRIRGALSLQKGPIDQTELLVAVIRLGSSIEKIETEQDSIFNRETYPILAGKEELIRFTIQQARHLSSLFKRVVSSENALGQLKECSPHINLFITNIKEIAQAQRGKVPQSLDRAQQTVTDTVTQVFTEHVNPIIAKVEDAQENINTKYAEVMGQVEYMKDQVEYVKDEIKNFKDLFKAAANKISETVTGTKVFDDEQPAGAGNQGEGSSSSSAAARPAASPSYADRMAGKDQPENSSFQGIVGWIKDKALSIATGTLTQFKDYALMGAASSVVTMFQSLRNTIDGMDNLGNDKRLVLQTLDSVIARLQNAQLSANLSDWVAALKDIPNLLSGCPVVNIMGVELPFLGAFRGEGNTVGNSTEILNRMAQDLRTANNQETEEIDDVEESVKTEYYKTRVQEHASMFGLHWIIEKILAWFGNSSFGETRTFAGIMKQVHQPFPDIHTAAELRAEQITEVKNEYYYKLKDAINERQDVNGLVLFFVANIVLPCINWFVNLAVKHYAKTAYDLIQNKILKYDPQQQGTQVVQAIEPAYNATIIYNDILKAWASNQASNCTSDSFVEKVLNDPSIIVTPNLNYSITQPAAEITREAAEVIMDDYFPPLDIVSSVRDAITGVCDWANGNSVDVDGGASRELNNALKVGKWLVALIPLTAMWIGWCGAKVFEMILSWAFKWGAKKAISETGGLSPILKLTEEALYSESSDSTVEKLLLSNINDACVAIINSDPDEEEEGSQIDSEVQRALTRCVKSFLQVLDKRDHVDSPDDLQRYIDSLRNPSLGQSIETSMKDRYLPKIIDNVVKIFGKAVEKVLKPEHSTKQYNKLLMTLDNALLSESRTLTPAEIEEKKADRERVQNQLKERLEFLLRYVIHYSIKKEIGSLGSNQKNTADEYISWVKEALAGAPEEKGLIQEWEAVLHPTGPTRAEDEASAAVDELEKLSDLSKKMESTIGDWFSKYQALKSRIGSTSLNRLSDIAIEPMRILEKLTEGLTDWREKLKAKKECLEGISIIEQIGEQQHTLSNLSVGALTTADMDRLEKSLTTLQLLVNISPDKLNLSHRSEGSQKYKEFMDALKQQRNGIIETVKIAKENLSYVRIYEKLESNTGTGSIITELRDAAQKWDEHKGKGWFTNQEGKAAEAAYKQKLAEFKEIIEKLPGDVKEHLIHLEEKTHPGRDRSRDPLVEAIRTAKASAEAHTKRHVSEISEAGGRVLETANNEETRAAVIRLLRSELEDYEEGGHVISGKNNMIAKAQQECTKYLEQLKRSTLGVVQSVSLSDDELINLSSKAERTDALIKGIREDLKHFGEMNNIRNRRALGELKEFKNQVVSTLARFESFTDLTPYQRSYKNQLNAILVDYSSLINLIEKIENGSANQVDLNELRVLLINQDDLANGLSKIKEKYRLTMTGGLTVINNTYSDVQRLLKSTTNKEDFIEELRKLPISKPHKKEKDESIDVLEKVKGLLAPRDPRAQPQLTDKESDLSLALIDFLGYRRSGDPGAYYQVESLISTLMDDAKSEAQKAEAYRRLTEESLDPQSNLCTLSAKLANIKDLYSKHSGINHLPWMNIQILEADSPIVAWIEQFILDDAKGIAEKAKNFIKSPIAFELFFLEIAKKIIASHKKG